MSWKDPLGPKSMMMNSNTKGQRVRVKRREIIVVVVFIILGSLSIYWARNLFQFPTKTAEVSGVVIYSYENEGKEIILFLKLTTDDTINSYKAGELVRYVAEGNISEFEAEKLVRGIPYREHDPAIKILNITQFLTPPIRISGTYVYVTGTWLIARTLPGTSPFGFPYAEVGIVHLGDKPIIDVRFEVNGTIIPFSGASVPIKWFDPGLNKTMGLDLIVNQTYPVKVKIVLPGEFLVGDEIVITHNENVKAIEPHGYSICLASWPVEWGKIDLLRTGEGRGIVSTTLREVTKANITGLFFYINDRQVVETSIEPYEGGYWALSTTVPFDIWQGVSYNVTINLRMSDGRIFSNTQKVTCLKYDG